MRIVLDTNVLVSALLTSEGHSAKILSLILEEEIVPLVDDRILREYEEVLLRPKFHLAGEIIEGILSGLEDCGEYISPVPVKGTEEEKFRDKSDLPFIEVALAGNADVLVTGNKKDFIFAKAPKGLTVLSPAEFLSHWSRKKNRH